MPTYEYACKACDYHFDVVQSFTDDPITVCPKCGGEVRKVFGSVGIVFKGSGFYKTDSRGAKTLSQPSQKTEASDTVKPDSTTAASVEKPAASSPASESA